MAASQAYSSAYIHYMPQQWTAPYLFHRTSTERPEKKIDSGDVIQGRIFWLPSKEELPGRAVRRAHGKGTVEEGIYHHPVVVISRPAEENHVVHFHLITSLQGKKLDQLYNKANEFHASRRSWYLPIAPTPDHPDATSKKTKKRFPTLELANGAVLRWDSYVNIRHVYKIEWSLLKAYTNPETPNTQLYRYERESLIRLLAKSKILTGYEAGQQHQSLLLKRSVSEPIRVATHITQKVEEGPRGGRSPSSDRASVISVACSIASSPPRLDFRRAGFERYRKPGPPPKIPPDIEKETIAKPLIPQVLRQALEKIFMDVKQAGGKPVTISFDVTTITRPVDRFWMDFKGVMAVAVASM